MKEKHLQNIIQANNDNRLAIFIGAGVTKSCDTEAFSIPLWSDLIREMKNELDLKDEYDYLKIAELYHLEFGEYVYLEKLKSFFPTNINPSEVYNRIFELNPNIIITTNWDNVLEKAINNNAYIYEIIRNDADLVTSTFQKKLIKMHGDFSAHNLVFKESDYLNYSDNFPLIENYIKSILSTHTVLFLGYSYSDFNLKQVMKWLQYRSEAQPLRYLSQFKDNKSQTQYFKTHGINTLTLFKPHALPNYEQYTENLLYFVDSLVKKSKQTLVAGTPEQIVIAKLKALSGLDRILFDQIQKVFTNCRVIFHKNCVLLSFLTNEDSLDNNPLLREIYQKFITNINKEFEDNSLSTTSTKILQILSRANITGLAVSKNGENSGVKYIPIKDYDRKEVQYIDFESYSDCVGIEDDILELVHRAFELYQIQKYEKSYYLTEKIISLASQEKLYSWLFIGMFNKNCLLRHLKSSWLLENNKFETYDFYDLEEEYLKFPKDVRVALKPILKFIDFRDLLKFTFEASREVGDQENRIKIRQGGGFSFNSDDEKTACRQRNLISFVLANGIMIENYVEFKHFNKQSLAIALIRQLLKSEFTLSRTELFSVIKYLKPEELQKLFKYHYDAVSEEAVFVVAEEDKKWLLEKVFINLIQTFNNAKNLYKEQPFNLIKNTTYLLSLIKLSDAEISSVIDNLSRLSSNWHWKNKFDEIINRFINYHNSLLSSDIKKETILSLVTDQIDYFLDNTKILQQLQHNDLTDVYYSAKDKNIYFEDSEKITKLIEIVRQFSIFEQVMISRCLMLPLAEMVNKQNKKQLTDFVLEMPLDELSENGYLLYSLDLEILDLLELDNKFIEKLESFLHEQENSKSLGGNLHEFKNKLDYLFKNKKLDKFKISSEIATRLSEKLSSTMRNFSIH